MATNYGTDRFGKQYGEAADPSTWIKDGALTGLQPVPGNPGLMFNPTNNRFVTTKHTGGTFNSETSQNDYTPSEYWEFAPGALRQNLGGYRAYNTDGTFKGEGNLTPEEAKGFAMKSMLAMMSGGALAGSGLLGAASGAGNAVGNAGGFIGEGVMSGIPAWDAAGTLGAGGFLGEGAISGIPAWDAAGAALGPGATATMGASGTGAAGVGAGAATGGGSFMNGLGGIPSLGGLASTVIGGLLGSKGQETSQTTTRDIPPWLKPHVTGDGTNPGLLNYATGLLNQQMSPQGQEGWQAMSRAGQGLLAQPVAGNGFSRFSQR